MPVNVVPTEVTEFPNLMTAAIFETPSQAEVAFNLLQQSGFDARHVSFLQRKGEVLAELEPPSDASSLITPDEQPLAENPVLGALSGGAIGGAAGWLVGLGLVAVPGVGPFLAAGTLGTLLTSAAIGAAAGGAGGALLLWGTPHDIAHHYSERVDGTRCLLVIETNDPDQQTQGAELLTRAGGSDVRTFTRDTRKG